MAVAVETRPELVGKRFLCVGGGGEEPPESGRWRAGVIRAVSQRDSHSPDLAVRAASGAMPGVCGGAEAAAWGLRRRGAQRRPRRARCDTVLRVGGGGRGGKVHVSSAARGRGPADVEPAPPPGVEARARRASPCCVRPPGGGQRCRPLPYPLEGSGPAAASGCSGDGRG